LLIWVALELRLVASEPSCMDVVHFSYVVVDHRELFEEDGPGGSGAKRRGH